MDIVSAVDLGPFAAASNEFAASLYHELRRNEGNLFFSPFSIRSGLILAYLGARGRTARQMAEVMRLPDADAGLCRAVRGFEETLLSRMDRGAIEVDVANAIWRQKGMPLLKSYADMVREAFGARLLEADLSGAPEAASRAINDWTNKKTRGRIPALLSPKEFGHLTRLVLANAVFFDGKWALPFREDETRPGPFHLRSDDRLGGGTVDVPMMRREGEFRYGKFEGFEMLEMPYRGDKLSMIILLPYITDGWEDLEKRLDARSLSQWIQALRPDTVNVRLPRFGVRSSFRLNDALERMGMGDAFSPSGADFTGMTPEKPLNIGSALHAAKIEVDETGTRAAAVTMELLMLGRPPSFFVDHPFLFLIRDIPMDAILFMGRVLNPAQ
jgi:serpin B